MFIDEKDMALIVKIGGSLYDLPDLRPRLQAWLASQPGGVVVVPGGGPMVESLRRLDRLHHLGEEACHWLALRTLTINAHFLAQLLPGTTIVSDPRQCPADGLAIMDMFPFTLADELRPGRLPHSWDVTSDSLAVRVAIVGKARKLVLLKSVGVSGRVDWRVGEGRRDLPADVVDRHFDEVLRQAPDLQVDIANLRLT